MRLPDWLTYFLDLGVQFGLPATIAAAVIFLNSLAGWITLPFKIAAGARRASSALNAVSRSSLGARRHAAIGLVASCVTLPICVAAILKIGSTIASWAPYSGSDPFDLARYLPSLLLWDARDAWIGRADAVLALVIAVFLVAQLAAPRLAAALEFVVGGLVKLGLVGVAWVSGGLAAAEIVMTIAHAAGASAQLVPVLLVATGLGCLGNNALEWIASGLTPALR